MMLAGHLCSRRGHFFSDGQLPVLPDEMTVVAIRNALEVVLMLRLGFPEIAGWSDFGDHLARPKPRSIDVGDRVFGNPLLFFAGVEDRRAVARADVVALAVPGRWIMDLEEKFENPPIADRGRIEDNLDRFRVGAVIVVGGVSH